MNEEVNSSDDDFADELIKNGLKITCKRNLIRKKIKGKKIKLDVIEGPPANKPVSQISEEISDSVKNSKSMDIENLPFYEKIGNQYIKLDSRTLIEVPPAYQSNPKPDDSPEAAVSLEFSTSLAEVSAANHSNPNPDDIPEAAVSLECLNSLIDVPAANQSNPRPDDSLEVLLAYSPHLIEDPTAIQSNPTMDDSPEAAVSLDSFSSLIEVPAANQSNPKRDDSPETTVSLECLTSLIDVPAEIQSNPKPDDSSEAAVSLEFSTSLAEVSAANHSNPNPDDTAEAAVSLECLNSLIDVPAANQSNPKPDDSLEVLLAYSPHLIEDPAAIQSNPTMDDSPDAAVSLDSFTSLIEVPAANQLNPKPDDFPEAAVSHECSRTEQSIVVINIISDVPYHGDLTQNKKRNNKFTKDPKQWQRNMTKKKREKGESYLGYRRDKKAGSTKFKVKHDVFKPARSMQPTCTSSFCVRSKLRACDSISPESRQHLFTTFWKNLSWEQRRAYICSHVTKIEKKITKNPNSNRSESRAYYLTTENVRYQVCKKMFLATLGIKDWFVRYWLNKTDCAMPPDTQNSQKQKKGPEKIVSREYAIQFLTKLPKMPSHYCRESTSKLYLEPIFHNMVDLYKAYESACDVDSQQCAGRKLFTSIFNTLNLSIFHPKKDQCDLCCSHKVGNLGDEDYNQHILKKNRARAEKATDKLFAQSGKYHVFTQDVESVKLVPLLQASAIYYKTKLCVHNFTLYNLATQEVMCYWFDESNSTLEASVFASCLVEHISNTLCKKSLPIILYSDGCCAQNRNAILSNALLRLAIEKKVTITQKYLEKGHTQMECDSVHSAIECKIKGKEIYLPEHYVNITKKSRSHPMPYETKLLCYNFFTDFSKNLIYKSIRPGNKTGDPVVTDLRLLQYSPNGTIQFKTCFDEELKPLPLRPTPLYRIQPISELPKLYKDRLPITKRKYQDLQDLKAVIPETCHSFYDQLPHSQ